MNQDSLIEENFRLNDGQKKALKKLKIKTIKDLLYYFPTRYGDISKMQNISGLRVGENAVVFGKISGLKTGKAFIRRTPMAEAFIEDETGKIKAIWFHQPYIAKMIHEGVFVRLDGKITERKGILGMINPKIETVVKIPTGVGDSLFGSGNDKHSLYPVYPESRGSLQTGFITPYKKFFPPEANPPLVEIGFLI